MKVVLSVMFLTLLVGCGRAGEPYNGSGDLLTDREKVMLDRYYEDHKYSGYSDTMWAVKMSRKILPADTTLEEGRMWIVDQKAPFCDVINTLEKEESPDRASVQGRSSILTLWEDFKGETLRESCGLVEPSEVVEQDIKGAEETNPYIAASEYEALRESVKECGIARVKLIVFMDQGLLTQNEKDHVNKLILQCEHDKLREELNKIN